MELHRGRTLGGSGTPDPAGAPEGLSELEDERVAQGIESLNLMFQTVSWAGVAPDLPRTFVRCLRDPIQSWEVQARLVANAAATEVIDLDTGHSPARTHPAELARLLAAVVDRAGTAQPTGSRIVKRVPRPGALSTAMVPPWATTTSWVIARPSPVPPFARLRDVSGR